MTPVYLAAYQSGNIQKVNASLQNRLRACDICPRKCGVNRLQNEAGYCKTGLKAKVYSYLPHQGEEPAISGTRGSGTVFFANCNLSCVYCQNYEFSQLGRGKEVLPEELAGYMLELQEAGCHNINLVTPTHVLPQIIQALLLAIPKGLRLPLVYNTAAYELVEVVRLLDGIIDIYLPDMRYADDALALKYSAAAGYVGCNQGAVLEMYRQAGLAAFDSDGVIERGLIIRHLVLPNGISGTPEVMQFIAERLSPEIHISLMSQYLPYHLAKNFPAVSRRLKAKEYDQAKQSMDKFGLHNGWVQESYGSERFAGVNIKPNLLDG